MKNKILKKLFTTAAVAIIATVGLVGCGSSKDSKDDTKAPTTTEVDKSTSGDKLKEVRIGLPSSGDGVLGELFNLADKNGYVEEELNAVGYTEEVKGFTGAGPEINEALASSSLDIAIYGDFPTFTIKSNGIDVTVIASTNHKQGYGILTANKEIKKPKDLEGKNVIVPQGTAIQFFWDTYAEINGIDTSKVNIINTVDSSSLLASGEADALVSPNYSNAYMESIGVGTVFDDGSNATDGYISYCVTVRTEYLKENPDVAVALNKALVRAFKDAQENPDAYYEAVASKTISADIEKKAYAFDPKLEYLNPGFTDDDFTYYNRLNEHLVEYGIITKEVDVEQLFDRSYYDKAIEELGN